MKRRQKVALMLSSVYLLTMLGGCSDKKDENTLEVMDEQGNTEVINIDELSERKIIFEPGEHIVYFQQKINISNYNVGWGNGDLNIPEVPEGYTLVNVFSVDSHGYTSKFIYMFVNNKTVEASASYNSETKKIEYHTPGVIVDTFELKK